MTNYRLENLKERLENATWDYVDCSMSGYEKYAEEAEKEMKQIQKEIDAEELRLINLILF